MSDLSLSEGKVQLKKIFFSPQKCQNTSKFDIMHLWLGQHDAWCDQNDLHCEI